MKKKFSVLTIVVALLSVFALVFSSCSSNGNIDDIINGGTTDNGVYPSADYDSAQIEQKLNEMKANGVYVKVRVTGDGEDEEYFAYGAKGEVYFFQYGDSDDQMWLDLNNNDYFVQYDCEETDMGALVWTKNVTHYNQYFTKETLKQTAEAYASAVWANLGYYANLTGEGTKTQITMLGRSCDKYVVKNGATTIGASVGWTIECVVDKASGVCLKYAISAEATTVDGRESASFTIEATDFDASWSPRLPQASYIYVDGEEQQGGETPDGNEPGGNTEPGGEVPQDSVFANKKLVATSVDCSSREVAAIFANAHASLFMSSDFELVSGMGVLFGTYTIEDNDRYANLETFKVFDFDSQEYSHSVPQTLQILAITREGTDGYRMDLRVPVSNGPIVDAVLHMSDSGTAPMREDLPNDPNGDIFNTQYQIEQDDWDFIFKDRGLLAGGNRFTVAQTSDEPYSANGTFKVDRNKIEDSWEQGATYYEKTGNTPDQYGQYAYAVYMRDGNTWYTVPANYAYEFFDDELGIVPVPFEKLNYSSTGRYYYVNLFRWTETGSSQESEVQNYKVWFADGNVQKIEYNVLGRTYTRTFNYSAYGTTTVELPQTSGGQSGGQPSQDVDDYYALLENKTLVYNRVTNNNGALDNDELALANEASEGVALGIFEDNEAELHFEKAFDYDTVSNVASTFYGTLEFTEYNANNGNPCIKGRIVMNKAVIGEEVQTSGLSNMMVRWYINDSQMRLQMDGYFIYLEVSDETPTHIPVPSGGGQDPGTDPGTDSPADTPVYISAKYSAETQEDFALKMMDFIDEDGFEFAIITNNGSEETTLTYKLMFDDDKFVIYTDQDGTVGIIEFLRDDQDYFYDYSFNGEAWFCEKIAYADAEGDRTSTMQSAVNDIFGLLWIGDIYRDMEFDSVVSRTGIENRDLDAYELETAYYSLTVVVDQETGAQFMLLMKNSNGGLIMVQCVTSFKTSTEIPAHEVEPEEPLWDEIEYVYQNGYDDGTYYFCYFAIDQETGVRIIKWVYFNPEAEVGPGPYSVDEIEAFMAEKGLSWQIYDQDHYSWEYVFDGDYVAALYYGEVDFCYIVSEYDKELGFGVLADEETLYADIEWVSQYVYDSDENDETEWYNAFEYFVIENGERVEYYYEIKLDGEPEIEPYYSFGEIKEMAGDEWELAPNTTWEYDSENNQIKVYVFGEFATSLYVYGYAYSEGVGECGYYDLI